MAARSREKVCTRNRRRLSQRKERPAARSAVPVFPVESGAKDVGHRGEPNPFTDYIKTAQSGRLYEKTELIGTAEVTSADGCRVVRVRVICKF